MFSLDLLLQISTKHDLFSLSMFLLHFFLNWFIFVLMLHIIQIHQITQMMIQCFFSYFMNSSCVIQSYEIFILHWI